MNSEPNIINAASGGQPTYEVISTQDIYRDDIAQKLTMKIPDERPFQWMKALGKDRMIGKRKAKRAVFSHYEDGEWFPATVTIAVKATPTANQVVVTLSTADHYGAGTRSYPKIHQLAIFQNETVGVVIATNKTTDNAHTVTILRQNTDQDVQSAAVVGQKLVFYSNEQEGGSKKTEGYIPEFEKVTHKIHTFREDQSAEDHEMQQALWFNYKGQPKLIYKALDDMAKRFNLQEDLGLLLTPEAEDVTGVQKGATIRSSTGLLPQIKAGGINMDYVGNPDQSTWETLELLLDKYYGDDENLIGQGLQAEQANRKWLKEFTKYGDKNINFDGRSSQDIKINFKSVELGSRKFHFQTWKVFTHPGSLGNMKQYAHMMVMIPMGGGKVFLDENRETSEYRKYMRMVYQQAPTKNNIVDDVYTWTTGALSPGQTSDELVQDWHRVSYKTLELFCINKFGMITKSDL